MKKIPIEQLIKPKSRNQLRKETAKDEQDGILEFLRSGHRGDAIGKPALKVLREIKAPEQLAPLMKQRERPKAPNGWEVISAVVDSGATITALHPEDAAAYPVQEGEPRGAASRTARPAARTCRTSVKNSARCSPQRALCGDSSPRWQRCPAHWKPCGNC